MEHTNILKASSFRNGCHPVAHSHLYRQKFHPGQLKGRIHFKERVCHLAQGRELCGAASDILPEGLPVANVEEKAKFEVREIGFS